MKKIKTGFLAVTGAVVGIITIRKLRNRSSGEPTDDVSSEPVAVVEDELEETSEDVEDLAEDTGDAKDEARTAVNHAGGTVKHAGLAAVKAFKSRRERAEPVDDDLHAVESN